MSNEFVGRVASDRYNLLVFRRILIPDTSPCLFYKFLGYLYSGILDKDSLSLDELAEVIALSDKYEVRGKIIFFSRPRSSSCLTQLMQSEH